MTTRLFLSLLLLLPCILIADDDSLIIENITIIDVAGKTPSRKATVMIRDTHIESITSTVPAKWKGSRKINGAGKYLIPGLWDMHVHWYDGRTMPLFIANGVTGVRQMSGNSTLLKWRDKNSHSLIPRHLIASPIFDGADPTWNNSIVIANAEDAQREVRRAKKQRFDFIKVYQGLSRDAYFAITEHARAENLPVCGHLPSSVTLTEAIDAGQKSVEHLNGVLLSCSSIDAQLRTERENIKTNNADASVQEALWNLRKKAGATFDPDKAAKLFEAAANAGMYFCPTLSVHRSSADKKHSEAERDKWNQYVPETVLEQWAKKAQPLPPDAADTMNRQDASLIGIMKKSGVKVLAGTDTGNPYCYPGFSLHDELALLVKSGLTPLEALQSATLNAAAFAGKQEVLGTVETGKLADLVILEADPLKDIRNTSRISAVIYDGKFYDRKKLDEILRKMQK